MQMKVLSTALVAVLLAAWSGPALACSCDKEARIKKYGTLSLTGRAQPAPSTPATTTAPAVPLPPATAPGS